MQVVSTMPLRRPAVPRRQQAQPCKWARSRTRSSSCSCRYLGSAPRLLRVAKNAPRSWKSKRPSWLRIFSLMRMLRARGARQSTSKGAASRGDEEPRLSASTLIWDGYKCDTVSRKAALPHLLVLNQSTARRHGFVHCRCFHSIVYSEALPVRYSIPYLIV